jgi:hypothetical protein
MEIEWKPRHGMIFGSIYVMLRKFRLYGFPITAMAFD